MELLGLIKGLVAVLVVEIVEASLPLAVLETLHLQPQVKEITAAVGQAMRLLIILPLAAAVLVQWVPMEHQRLEVMVALVPLQVLQVHPLRSLAVVAAVHLLEEQQGAVVLAAAVLDQQALEMAAPVMQILVGVVAAVAHLLAQAVQAAQAALA